MGCGYLTYKTNQSIIRLTWTWDMVEYPMFKNERDNMNSPNNKVFLIIKKTYWEHDGDTWFDVAEKAKSRVRAYKCIDALNTLNNDNKVSYLISELDNVEKKKEESKQLELPLN